MTSSSSEAHTLTDEHTKVGDDECLYCYLVRMVGEYGCDSVGHFFTRQWIDSQSRRLDWVLGWVRSNGGFCDCEVVFNVFRDDRRSQRHRRLRCEASYP
jgi:hypothetical protein